MPDLAPCLCGATPVMQPSAHRVDAREAHAAHLKALERRPHDQGDAARDVARTQLALQVMAPDHIEVSCAECGRWVHAESEEAAAATWTKAIEKLGMLQPCCQADYERRVDYDGQVMHVCTSPDHDDTIHGRRYLPLPPDPSYAPSPRDAERP